MKKNFKKLSSLALAFLLVFSLSFSAFAADISASKAKSIALKDAGYSSSEVAGLYAKSDYDDGVKYYEVGFYVNKSDSSVYEYDYEIRVSDGKILERDVDVEKKAKSSASSSGAASGKAVDAQAAKKAALKHFGVKEEDVKFLVLHRDADDGVKYYDIEFCKPYSVKYSCEVVISNGKVIDAEKEKVRGFADKFELFLGVLIWNLLNK